MESKEAIRKRIWSQMEREGIARFPRPVYHRIPNFAGAEKAARRLGELAFFREAKTIKVNPDAPQLPVRRMALRSGKRVLMPAPRLRTGFLILDPQELPESRLDEAATIKGAFRYGREIGLDELPSPDLIVVGSVAVAPDGARIGKGEGYSELEFAILQELGLVDQKTPVITTVHDVQVVEKIALDPYDVPVDWIVTPTQVIETRPSRPRPPGILWEYISEKMLADMPLLRLLWERKGQGAPGPVS